MIVTNMLEECFACIFTLKVVHSFELSVPTYKAMHATSQETMITTGYLSYSLKIIYKYYYISKYNKDINNRDMLDDGDDDSCIFLFIDSRFGSTNCTLHQ
jgi:hypothetical protein